MGKVSAAAGAPSIQEDKGKKKKLSKKKKSKKTGNILFPVYLSTGVYN